MKARRLLAGLLCAAMIFSSEAFSMGVMASELPAPVETEEMIVETEEEEVMEATSTPETVVEEETATAEEAEASETPSATVQPEDIPTAEPSEEPSVAPTQEPAAEPEVTEEPVETQEPLASPWAEATVSPEALPEVTPEAEETLTEEEIMPEETSSPEVTGEQDIVIDDSVVTGSEDFFDVTDDGTLTLIEGKEIYGSSVKVPAAAKKIPFGIFNEKTSVKNVEFEEGSLLTEIEAGAFEGSGIVEIEIPAGVTVIKEGTFKNSYLEEITFLGEVTTIEKEAFSDTPLTAIYAPMVTEVGSNAFSNCSALTDVKMAKLETIGARAFQYCSSLNTGMNWSSKLTKIEKEAFKGCGFTSLDLSVASKDGIVIDARVFENCTKLKSVILPIGMTEVSTAMFKGCTVLKSVDLGEGKGSVIKNIAEDAFHTCTSLESIIIPASVTGIQTGAFDACSALKEIYIWNPNPVGEEFVIAQHAFPNRSDNSKITMQGYDGKVQEYAASKGYKFETLYQKYNISYYPSDYGTMTINKNPVIPGEEVQIKITPKEGYCLDKDGLQATCSSAIVTPELVNSAEGVQTFRFIMPAGAVELRANYVELKSVATGTLSAEFAQVNGYSGSYKDKKLYMDKTGRETSLVMKITGEPVGAWLFDYQSSNTSVATVSGVGKITAKSKGTAKITATLKSDTTKKFSFDVVVEKNSFIDSIELMIGNPSYATVKEEVIDGNTYKVVEYTKTSLMNGAKTIDVSIKAKEAEDDSTNLIVSSAWKSMNTKVAGVSKATSTDNTNKVTVKKGTEGETMITVKVTNKDEDKTVCQESFIVRVIDATPRLADKKISVNSLSTEGTAIDVVEVYGYEINTDSNLRLCKKKVSKGIVSYPEVAGFRIEEEDGTYRVIVTEDLKVKSGETITYKESNQLYIKGEFDKTGDEFIIPVPELTVTNKALAPTIKLSGKINLFYNTNATDTEQGSVTVKQNLTKETVERYELVSVQNDKKKGSEEVDSFAANFTVSEPDEKGSATITRTATDMVKVDGKQVVTGYLYVYYVGYNQPVKKKITVSTHTTAPKYVLSQTSATASMYRTNQEYDLKLKDAKTKKNVLDLTENDTLSFNYLKTTDGLFDRTVLDSKIEDDIICLKVNGTPKKGKVVVTVKKESWTKSLEYTFNLKVTTKHPTVKLSSATATLNTLCPEETAFMRATLSGQDAVLTEFSEGTLVFTGKAKNKAAAQALMDEMTFSEEGIEVALPEGGVKAGTYSFKITPIIEYKGSEKTFPISAVSFKVTVKDDMPKVKLKSGTFNMNTLYPKKEEVSTTFSITNLPAGSTYTLDTEAMSLTPLKKTNSNALYMKDMINLAFDVENGKVTATLKEGTLPKFSYEYYVEDLSLTIGEKTVPLSKFKIKVVGAEKTPSLTIATKGTLNTVSPASQIVYTLKVGNVKSAVKEVKIWEFKSNGDYYYEGEEINENRTSEHFEGELVGNKFIVRAKDDAVLKSGTTYKIKLAYALEVSEDTYKASQTLSIKPKQTLPKVKTDKSSAYLYAGQNREKTVDVTITQTSVKDATIVGVDFAKGTSDAIKKAYRISYNEETGVMTLTLVNPAVLVLDKKYTVTFETKCDKQMTNSTGTTFKLNLTVRK